jgi:hypothetical protein
MVNLIGKGAEHCEFSATKSGTKILTYSKSEDEVIYFTISIDRIFSVLLQIVIIISGSFSERGLNCHIVAAKRNLYKQ